MNNKFNLTSLTGGNGLLSTGGGQFGMLSAQQPQTNPYEEMQRRDPQNQLWAGTIMDVGNIFANALAGSGMSTNNAQTMYQQAKQHNQKLDEAERLYPQQQQERELQNMLLQSKIAANAREAGRPDMPEHFGSPFKGEDGQMRIGVRNPDGSFGSKPIGSYASDGRIIETAGGTYWNDGQSPLLRELKILEDGSMEFTGNVRLEDGAAGKQPPQTGSAPAQSPQEGQPEPAFPNMTTVTPELQREREAEAAAAETRAKEQAKQDVAEQAKQGEYAEKAAKARDTLERINYVMDNFDQVEFGPVDGYMSGAMPFYSSVNDEFDSLSSAEVLKNAESMKGELSDRDMQTLREVSLSRGKSRPYNRKELERVQEAMRRAVQTYESKVQNSGRQEPESSTGGEAQEVEVDGEKVRIRRVR